MGEMADRTTSVRRTWLEALSWLPIPLLLATIAALWIADVRVVWSLRPLNWLVHYGSVALGVVFIVIPAARAVRSATRRSGTSPSASAWRKSSTITFSSFWARRGCRRNG